MSEELEKASGSEIAKLGEFSNMEEMKLFSQTLIDSGFLPKAYKTPEQVVASILQGKELGFEPLTSINNINVIQGKPTLNVHAIAAKIKQAGVTYTLVEDYEPVYEADKEGKDVLVDYRTTIEFWTKWQGETCKNKISYSMRDAKKQGLTGKDNWNKMPKIMLRTRCLAIGARFVAPEALMGLYETAEYAEVVGVNHTVQDDGTVVMD